MSDGRRCGGLYCLNSKCLWSAFERLCRTSEAASTCYCCHGPRPCLLSRPLPVRGPMQQHMAATMREAHHHTLPQGCVGARFIVPARAPLRESPDPLFPGGHCGAHLEGKPSSAPVIVNHCDGCHMWAAATQDCAAYQRGFGHFLPEFTIASARILCQCRRSSDFSAVGQYLRVEGCGNPRVP